MEAKRVCYSLRGGMPQNISLWVKEDEDLQELIASKFKPLLIFPSDINILQVVPYRKHADLHDVDTRYCDCNNEITDPEKDVCGDCR